MGNLAVYVYTSTASRRLYIGSDIVTSFTRLLLCLHHMWF